MYLLDTNTVSDYLRKKASVIKEIHRTNPKYVAISVITKYEIAYGLEKKPSLKPVLQPQINALYAKAQNANFELDAAIAAGKIRNDLITKGITIEIPDILIAAIALSRSWIVVTDNVKHFSQIDGLILENWRIKS